MFNLNFHFVLMFFASLNFSSVCLVSLIFLLLYLFVVKFISIYFFFFCTMVVVLVKEVRLVVAVDDLYFGVRNVVFKAKVFNRHGTFDRITNRIMENLDYAYLHCDLLDKATLITISFKVKSSQIHMSSICKTACL